MATAKKIEKEIGWEIKDRTYYVAMAEAPLTLTIPSRHTRKYSLLWFDEETGEQRELRYATNQNSPFVDEQKGEATMGHIMFNDGTLFVPKNKQNLQKLLSLYHPMLNKKYREYNRVGEATDDLYDLELELMALNAAQAMDIDQAEAILRVESGSKVSDMTNGTLFVPKNKQNLQKLLSLYHPMVNKKYREYDRVEEATDDLYDLELELTALNAAQAMDIDQAEAILRVESGSKVSDMTSKEIKRDLLLFAKRNPDLFIELANDENVQLRNLAIKAVEANIIKLSPDQRTFNWASNDKKLMTVPFDENPYSAMAAFFKTDEGTEVFKSIEKKLK